jgi:hypothetical protein
MPKKGQTKTKIEIEERRKKVAANILAGATYQDIARALDVSVGTIASDYKAILREWRAVYSNSLDKFIQLQLRRLDVLLNGVWERARKGDEKSVEAALAIMGRMDLLMGVGKGLPGGENSMAGVQTIRMIEVTRWVDGQPPQPDLGGAPPVVDMNPTVLTDGGANA